MLNINKIILEWKHGKNIIQKDAVAMKIYDELVLDAMLEDIKKRTAEGKPFEYKLDSRVVIKK